MILILNGTASLRVFSTPRKLNHLDILGRYAVCVARFVDLSCRALVFDFFKK